MNEEKSDEIKYEIISQEKSKLIGMRSHAILTMVGSLVMTFEEFEEERGTEMILNYLASAISCAISDSAADEAQEMVSEAVTKVIVNSVKKTREARNAAKSNS